MPTYTAEFHTNAEWAVLDIRAATPEKALKKARAVEPDTLDFEPYGDRQPVNYITIRDKHCNDLAEWQDDDLRIEKAARDLLKAAEKVISAWQKGDNLAGPRLFVVLADIIPNLAAAVAKAKDGAP